MESIIALCSKCNLKAELFQDCHGRYAVRCSACKQQTDYGSQNEVIKKWNRRQKDGKTEKGNR